VATSTWNRFLRAGARILRSVATPAGRPARPSTPRSAPAGRTVPSGPNAKADRAPYPGDFTGVVHPLYAPHLDGDADPGEVVWTWVPYEDDPTRGKDRPVLVVGQDARLVLGLMLTSKDHDRDAADEARWGRRWFDVGAGPWDAQLRPSEVRLDRVLRIDPGAIRREGAIMDRATFDRVVGQL
jgi:PemK-like, MazF-like toxin of type II toxin-antitoxin system